MQIQNPIIKKLLIHLLLIFTYLPLIAINPVNQYAVNNIPKTLLINSNAVIRADELIYTLENKELSKVKVKHAITLLNENASDYRITRIPYDKSISISRIKATVYNSDGEIIYSAKPEIVDMSGNFNELASDQRYWIISFPLRKYPYTIEYEFEKTIKESFFFEDWSFQSQPDVSIEKSGVQYIVPKETGFRIKELNLKHVCDTFSLPDKNIYTWQEENIPAYKPKDLFLLSFDKKAPILLTAPTNFNMMGFEGNMATWEAFGKWSYELNKNRDYISPELQNKLKLMISGISDKKEQIKHIYEYLQKTTRYESIQLGIGGYQTLEAGFVEKKGFGDCKALTNYMKAMLRSIGIKAYQALVLAGNNEIIYDDFPSQQFNHVILCVPLDKDTVWLECTSQTQPFNFLGSYTDNRFVLLLTENGGKLVKTPEYGFEANFRKTSIDLTIDLTGNASIIGKLNYSGLSYEVPSECFKEGKKEQEKWINDIFASPTIIIKKLDYIEYLNTYPSIVVNCNLQMANFASKTNKRLLFNPLLIYSINYIPHFMDDEFSIHTSSSTYDSITTFLPSGYIVNNIPNSEIIESKFGIFQNQYIIQNNKLIFIRKLTVFSQKCDKEDIKPFISFVNKIATLDRKLVILNRE